MSEVKNKKFYKKVAKEIGWNFSKVKIEKDVFGDFDYWNKVNEFVDETKVVLDVGCGSGEKILKNVNPKMMFAIDKEKEMLKKAVKNLKNYPDKKRKFKFIKMNGYKELKFNNNFFDVVISRHCGVNGAEMFRVLKEGGVFISEDVDKTDCQDLKEMFGRGQSFTDEIALSEKVYNEFLELGFKKLEKFDIVEIEYYKNIDDLIYLLKRTPIISFFGESETDYEILNEYAKLNTTEKGIKLTRKLFGIVAVK